MSAAFLLGALVSLAPGCDREPHVRVVSAEFVDLSSDEIPQQGEYVVLRLDRELPADYPLEAVRIETLPPSTWTPKLRFLDGARQALLVEIFQGTPRLECRGVYPRDPDAGALRVKLADGREQTVDLQLWRPIPRLESARWIDASPPGGNGVVDQDDLVRLRFSHAVRLPGTEPLARVPQEILLAKEIDRLDDGSTASRFALPDDGDEHAIDVVLGAHPILAVDGTLRADAGDIDRSSPESPSGLAINGTEILPMSSIVARGGGRGVASDREVDIALSDRGFEPLERFVEPGGERFPGGIERSFHTATAFQELVGLVAIIAGGVTRSGEPLADVLEYRPLRASDRLAAFEPIGALPIPSYHHSATLLPGADRVAGNEDDVLILAGGRTEGDRTIDTLTAVFVALHDDGNRSLVVETLEDRLAIPRAEHEAIAISHDAILFDGGRSRRVVLGADRASDFIVEAAELITFVREGDTVRVDRETRRLFRSIGRVHHSLSLLATGADGRRRALVFGGLGRNRYRGPFLPAGSIGRAVDPAEAANFLPESRASVIRWPVLLDLDDPVRSVVDVSADLSTDFLRIYHHAFSIGEVNEDGLVGASTVVILGGTLRHPLHPLDEAWVWHWDLSREHLRRTGGQLPTPEQAIQGLRFQWDERSLEWDETRVTTAQFTIVPHPTRAPVTVATRQHFSATSVPGFGCVLAGGEIPGVDDEPLAHATLDAYLTPEGRLAEFARNLRAPRTRHEAILVTRGEQRSIFLIGGLAPTGAPDVEEVPLPRLR